MGRRPIPKEQKTKPADYPQFAFRISKGLKASLTREIEKVQRSMNSVRAPGEPFINKNDVIVEALGLGLQLMSRGKRPLSGKK